MHMPLNRLFLLGFFILLSCLTTAQPHQIKGKVVDSKTKEPLAFVNITINDGRYGGTTDIDGIFTLQSNQKIHLLNFTYVGYEALYQPVYDSKNLFFVQKLDQNVGFL